MEDTRKPITGALLLALVAVTAVLAVVVFNWAANATASALPTQGQAPAQQGRLPIQDTQTTPAPPDGDRGGPENCPERDGRGGPGDGGPGGGSSSEAPQTTTPQPTEFQPEV